MLSKEASEREAASIAQFINNSFYERRGSTLRSCYRAPSFEVMGAEQVYETVCGETTCRMSEYMVESKYKPVSVVVSWTTSSAYIDAYSST
jgi:hypothetical protein